MSKKRTPKRARDVNELAFQIGQIATGQGKDETEPLPNPKAVARGKARAAKLDSGERKRIASKAAKARWNKRK